MVFVYSLVIKEMVVTSCLGRQSPALNNEKRQYDFVEVLLASREDLELRNIV
jgi:hypothetical protein